MRMANVVRSLGPIDLRNISRDPLLRWMCVLPLMLGLALWWLVPIAQARLLSQFQFDLSPYHSLIVSFVVMTMPTMSGVVIGFLLLDQKDDGTLSALQVSPMNPGAYLAYRLSVPILLSILSTFIVVPLLGLGHMSPWQILTAAATAAPLAPLFALFLVSVAANKVEGFAFMKATGALNWPPIFAYFIESDWQFAFGIVPMYWPAKVTWMLVDNQPGVWIFVAAGLLYQGLLLWWLTGRFERSMTRSS